MISYLPEKERIMTAREAKKDATEINNFIKQLPPEKINEIVVKAGIYTPDGKLTKPYRPNV
jgi:hypothetical protein